MAFIHADSFDFYNSSTITLLLADAGTHWDSVLSTAVTAVVATANTRFLAGTGIAVGAAAAAAGLVKASATNDQTHHVAFAYRNNGVVTAGNALTFTFFDGATAQCSVVFDPSGPVILKAGLGTGTVLATWSTTFTVGTWYHVEFEVTIDSSAGAFRVRVNGNTANDFQQTAVNTRVSANSYANKLQIGVTAAVTSNVQQMDDLLWFSTTGAAPNTWVGDVRAQQLMSSADVVANLDASPVVPFYTFSAQSTGAVNPANNLWTSNAVVATYGGMLASITLSWLVAYTGKYRLAIYDNTGPSSGPGTLLAQTAEQTNAAIGSVPINLTAPLTLAAGRSYFVALLNDTATPAAAIARSTATAIQLTTANTYVSGFPATIITTGTSAAGIYVQLNAAPFNAGYTANLTEDGDTSFVYGNTAGVGDLYDITDLSVVPVSIVAVQTRMCMRKNDTSLRQARIQVKSGGTTSNGPTVTLGTTYGYYSKVDTVDPDTGSGWTAAGVSALQIGPYVVT